MKILVVGASGMLGHKVYQELVGKHDVYGTIYSKYENIKKYGFSKQRIFESIDARIAFGVGNVIREIRPHVVINCVGIVKSRMQGTSEVDIIGINSLFPHQLKEVCETMNVRLIHISTDCVFSGKTGFYKEFDAPDADDIYGKTKLLGEVIGDNMLTLRTSIIGRELETSHNLIEWFLGNKDKTIFGYTNVIFSGFPTLHLSRILIDIIESHQKLSGLYHVSSEPISKYDLLCLVKKYMNLNIGIEKDFVPTCNRSLHSNLFCGVTRFKPKSWDEMIGEFAEDAKQYEQWR